jgi:hypothetical protein
MFCIEVLASPWNISNVTLIHRIFDVDIRDFFALFWDSLEFLSLLCWYQTFKWCTIFHIILIFCGLSANHSALRKDWSCTQTCHFFQFSWSGSISHPAITFSWFAVECSRILILRVSISCKFQIWNSKPSFRHFNTSTRSKHSYSLHLQTDLGNVNSSLPGVNSDCPKTQCVRIHWSEQHRQKMSNWFSHDVKVIRKHTEEVWELSLFEEFHPWYICNFDYLSMCISSFSDGRMKSDNIK